MANTPTRNQEQDPQDALFSEFQSYVRAIYEHATSETIQSLESGCREAVSKLQRGIEESVSGIDDNSGKLAEVIASARSDFRGMFEPIFEDYRRKLLEDHVHFIDLLAGKLVSKQIELHRTSLDATKGQLDNSHNKLMTGVHEIRDGMNQAVSDLDGRVGKLEELLHHSTKQLSATIISAKDGMSNEVAAASSRWENEQVIRLSKQEAALSTVIAESELRVRRRLAWWGTLFLGLSLGGIVMAFLLQGGIIRIWPVR